MAENLEENLNKLNCIEKIDNSNRAIAFKTDILILGRTIKNIVGMKISVYTALNFWPDHFKSPEKSLGSGSALRT